MQGVVQELKNGRMEERANKILRDSVAADLANIKLDTQLEHTGHMYTHTYRVYASVCVKEKEEKRLRKRESPLNSRGERSSGLLHILLSVSHTHTYPCVRKLSTLSSGRQ